MGRERRECDWLQEFVEKRAPGVQRKDVEFLDARGVRVRDDDGFVAERGHSAPVAAGQTDDGHLPLARGFDCPQDVG